MNLPNVFFNNDNSVFINLEVGKSSPNRKIKVDDTFRAIYSKAFYITVDNSTAQSHNINIDYPFFFCFAINQSEAIQKMMQSDFCYKHKEIYRITVY